MTNFFEYIKTLSPDEKKKFRKKIIQVCGIEPPTFYSWIQRRKVAVQSQILIAAYMKQDRETLFPETEN